MDPNTQTIVTLYNTLGDKLGPDGKPILTLSQVQQTTVTTYMGQRTFDPKTGIETSPLLTVVDSKAIDDSLAELSAESATINEIKGLIAQVTPSTPVAIAKGK